MTLLQVAEDLGLAHIFTEWETARAHGPERKKDPIHGWQGGGCRTLGDSLPPRISAV